MKMRKILSAVVAGALMASTMIIGASAASVERSKSNEAAFKKAVFKGTISFSELYFRTGSQISLTMKNWGLEDMTKLAADEVINIWAAKLNGVHVFNNFVSGGTTYVNFGIAAKDAKGYADGSKGYDDYAVLPAGKYSTFNFEIEAVIQKNDYSTTVVDKSNKMGDNGFFKNWSGDAKSYPVTVEKTLGNVTIGDSEPVVGGIKLTGEIKFDTLADAGSAGAATTIKFANNKDDLKLSVSDKGIIRNAATAKVDVILKDTNADIGLLKIKIDSTDVTPAAVSKDAKNVSVNLPIDLLYDANYDGYFGEISLETTNGKIVSAVLTIEDGVAAPDTTEPADGDADADTTEPGEEGDDVTDEDGDDVTDEDGDEWVDGDETDLDGDVDEGDETDVDEGDETDVDEGDDFDTDSTDDGSDADAAGDNSNEAAGSDDSAAGGAADDSNAAGGAGDTTADGGADKAVPTGVAVAVIPAIIAAAATVVARKRK